MKKLFLFIIIITLSYQSIGQTEKGLNKEVEVVKPYKPTIREAIKISDMPRFQPQDTEKPEFDYNVHQQTEIAPKDLDNLEVEKVSTSQQYKQGIGLVRLGFGNYQLPYGELFLNHQLNNTTFGLNISHLNSIGKITLVNNDRVNAPSSETNAELYINHYFDNITAIGRIYFDQQAFRYYGYTGNKLSEPDKETLMPWWNHEQKFPTLGLEVNLGGNTELQNNFKYNGSLNIQHFETNTGQIENLFKIRGRLEQDFEYFKGRLNIAICHVGADSIYNSSKSAFIKRSQTFLEAHPSVSISTEEASLRVGFNNFLVLDPDDNDFLITPMAEASWTPIKNMLTLFAEINGYMRYNHYSAITAENRYVNPYHNAENTKYPYIINGGLRGRLNQSFSYNLKGEYSSIKKHQFYTLQNQRIIDEDFNIEEIKSNTFDIIYDDLKQFSMGGEMLYNYKNEWSLLLKAAHYAYNNNIEPYAWNLPNFEASLSFRYNMPVQPLRFTTDINFIGERKGLERTLDNNEIIGTTTWNLPAIIDLTLGAEYKFSDQLSFWAKINNMTSEKYDRWQGYTNKRLNFIVGLSFSF